VEFIQSSLGVGGEVEGGVEKKKQFSQYINKKNTNC